MVVKVHSDKYLSPTNTYRGEYVDAEITVAKIQELIENGNFTAEFIPAACTTQSTGTLIIEEKL